MKNNHVWKLLTEHSFTFIVPLTDEYICTICKTILKNPQQCPCGCRYCKECIIKYINNAERFCPGEKDDCKEQIININQDLQIDYFISKKISAMSVKCPEKSCEYSDELRNIEQHINSHIESCPFSNFGCDIPNLQLKNLMDHLNNANFCHSKLLVKTFTNFENELTLLRENFKIEKENSEKKTYRIENLENKLNDSLYNNNSSIKLLQENLMKFDKKNESIQEKLKNVIIDNETSKTVMENQQKIIEKLQQEIAEFKSCLNSSNIEEKRNKLNHQYKLTPKYSEFEWKITQFSKKLESARKENDRVLTSESFYSHFKGYKMCLTLYPNGCGYGMSTHISVFVHIMKGEYDDKLPWPMNRVCSLRIIDANCGISWKTFKYHYNSVSMDVKPFFNKPRAIKNIGFGEPRFIELNAPIIRSNLIADDSILIMCSVE